MRHFPSATFSIMLAFVLCRAGSLDAEVLPKFTNLSVERGLSQNSVWAILRDRQGFLWFATDDGLNKFDGYTFTVYRHIKGDSTSLLFNTPRALMQDKTGRMWVATSGGLNVYDPATDRFSVYRSSGDVPEGLTSRHITCITGDRDGGVWVGTRNDGLYRIDPAANTHRRFGHVPGDATSLSSDAIASLYLDRDGTVWIGTQSGGINAYQPESGTFTSFRNDPRNPRSLSDNTILSFYEDSRGRFWLGTLSHGIALFNRRSGGCQNFPAGASMEQANMDSLSVTAIAEDASGTIVYATFGGGVKLLDPSSGRIRSWYNDIRDVHSLAGNAVISLFRDGDDILWIGTYAGGISKYDANGEHFQTFRNQNPRPDLFSENNIRCIYRDDAGSIWLGTTKGLDIFDPVSGRCEHFTHKPGNATSLADDYVRSIFRDSKGTMWIGTRNGLNTFDMRTKIFTRCTPSGSTTKRQLHTNIRAIVEDMQGIVWFGTSTGLCSYDRTTRKYTSYTADFRDTRRLSSDNIRSLFIDRSGVLWCGIYGAGICRFDRETGTFTRYTNIPGDTTSLNNVNASPINEDDQGNLWIGTYGGGLNKFDPRTGKFVAYTESDGLTNNTIFGILKDGRGDLWISTFDGVSRFTPSTGVFRNFTAASGLQSREFNLNSSFRDRDGTMFFGGHFGFNQFHPDKIRVNAIAPPVYITGMSIFNKPVHWDSAMTAKRLVVLPYDRNSFSIDFVALNFRKSELNRYMYKLEGFDAEWTPAGTERKASYTNLVPGEYVFRVVGSNNDDVWNMQGASLSVVITPPFWKTWWAYALYVIAFAAASAGAARYGRKRQKTKLFMERQRFEQDRLEKINAEIAQERILLRTVIDNIPMAVYAKDVDARKVITNAVDLAVINRPEHDVLGRTDIEVFPAEVAARSMADDFLVIRNGVSIIGREELVFNAAGEGRWLLTSKLPWRDNEGTIIGLVGIALDITERKRLEQQLLQSQKLEGVGTLAGGIAHDFNNLLAMILGSAELLQRQLSAFPDLKKYVDRIIEASERGASISRQLLIFSRPDEAELKPISLSHTITELKEMLKHFLPKSIAVVTEMEVDNGIIMGDAGQIHQALLNLALNAGDAMKNSGRLTIREFTVPPDAMKKLFSLERPGPFIAVCVSDTGVGMDEKTRVRIFDPFFTTKAPGKGTGLGLGIVHGIVKNHNGLIHVESTPGAGSSFTLYFPAAPHEPIAAAPVGSAPATRYTGRILLVDDEQLLRDLLCEALSDSGYTVHQASNGAEALAFFTAHREEIDLVITDLGMPEMGGEELFRELRRIDPGVKVVVSSGYLDGTTRESLLRMGIKDVLIKPFKMQEIYTAVWSVFDKGWNITRQRNHQDPTA